MRASQLATVERRLVRERAYWLAALEGEPEGALLPLDFARPAQYVPKKALAQVELGPAIGATIARVAGQEPALAFSALVTALAVCLRRYTGRTDVVIGTGVPPALTAAAGFNDLVPLRLRTPPDRSAGTLLVDVKGTIADAFRHARYPFDRILDLLAVVRPPNRTPLVGITALFEGLHGDTADVRAMTDVVVIGGLRDGCMTARVEYDPRLFLPGTMRTFGVHLARTLEWLFAHLQRPTSELILLADAERQALVVDFNASAATCPSDVPIHMLIERQVDREPARVAARSGSRRVSYGELDAAANRIAHVLAGRGVRAGSRVGILLPHSPETLAAIIGVLKTGAAYVPLDPAHPPLRLSFVLDDARVADVVTTSDLAPLAGDGRRVLRLDADHERLDAAPATRPVMAVSPDDAAYVIYTSGSTGTPKGVVIPHRALVNYIWWAKSSYGADGGADFALHSSLSFDLTVTSVFTPLVAGGTVVAYPRGSGEPAIIEVLRDDQADVVKLTPSHLALIADQRLAPSRLRALIVGGENLDAGLARRIHDHFGGRVALYNEYGPTEATVGCMIHRFDPATDRRNAVPIGVPAANTEIYVLDERLEPAPPNAVGELYIGGAGLADGYLDRPALTAERFVPNPFRAGRRLYRTGDLARPLPEGTIEFLGRRDEEVKVRGHRIDLSEVRAAFVAHPGIRDCAVRRFEDGTASVLVAYYVSRQPLEEGELRAFVRSRLVEAAVPTAFLFVRRLPLTLNGKVNIGALPDLEAVRAQSSRVSEPPRTATELALAGIWGALLRLDRVGVHDNFFELGGHSLLATQVVSRVRDALGVELPLRVLFERPTIAGLAAVVDATGVQAAQQISVPRASRDTPLPLSFAQHRLWFLDQLDPGSAAYNIAARIRIEGRLDVPALRASLNLVIARHESLRTTFDEHGGRPVQRIRATLDLELPTIAVPGASEVDRAQAADAMAAQESARPFDLATGPLVRAMLHELSPEDHVLLVTLHHAVADGWSLRVFAQELSSIYAARLTGHDSGLSPLTLQYADYAVWQRQTMAGERLSSELAFWREALADVPVIELPTDRPRPAMQRFLGASLPVMLAPALARGVREVGAAMGATPFMILLAAYAALLHRCSGQADLAIGCPIANRTHPEFERVIGFFANTLVLRVRLDGHPSFRELVRRVRSVVLDASAHQDLPFERLVEELQPERALSYNPLFQVMFGLTESAADALALPGARLTALQAETGTAKFDLNLLLEDDGTALSGTLEYNTDLFDAATIVRFRDRLETLLAAALADPDGRVGDLRIMPEPERRLVTVEWNRTEGPLSNACAHELVEAAAGRHPDRIAVVFPGEPDDTLTYAELDTAANRLAHHLRSRGVGPDVPVALCLERSLDMAVAVLAVLKAGGAYVSLDPAYPRERLSQMLEDTAAPVVLAHAPTRDQVPQSSRSRVLWLDAEREAILAQPSTRPKSGVAPENLLYVIYTSGSTGRPKGIALAHRALVNLISWSIETLPGGRAMLQFASLGFDVSFHEMFATWASGRMLVMIRESWRRDPSELLDYLERWPVETAILPGVVLHQWAESRQGQRGALGTLRHMITTGEQLVVTQPIIELFQQLPQCRLHNHYGPSETHVVTALTLGPDPSAWPARPSIGEPILNSTIFILDARLHTVPIGVTGELYIGGANLARGYLNRPDLTAAKFVPNPFSATPGARLYRTGDLARWQPDGTVEFLGRADDQVKIRGFRVELGDVESALNGHGAVSQNVVVAAEGAAGRRLVAYVVPVAGAALTTAALHDFARNVLPDYMVPSVFVVLEGVALTQNGKIDRRALPPPPDDRPDLAQAFVPPATPAEELMAAIWRDLLGVARVGAHDNFFHMGGHSLVATQLVSRIRQTFEIDLKLKSVFETPTVAGLVDALGALVGSRDLVDEIAATVRMVEAMSTEDVRAQLTEARAATSG